MKKLIILACLALLTFIFATSSLAAVPSKVKVVLTPEISDPTNKTKIAINWSLWDTGDQFARSLDGTSWDTLSDAGTFPGGGTLTITGGVPSYIENNFPNYDLVYFKISNGTNSKRVNVYPPIEHGHANYADDTNKCGLCHLTHTAVGARLLSKTSIQELCNTCHGIDGTGSRYNVQQGTVRYSSSGSPAYGKDLAGPFTQTSSQWGNTAITSSHNIEGPLKLAPGGTQTMSLTCIDCHNAHASNENYRLLNTATIPEKVDKAFSMIPLTPLTADGFREQGVYYDNGMNRFCKSCHDNFQQGSGSGHTTTDAVYRHATEVELIWTPPSGQVNLSTTLPIYKDTADGNKDKIFCLTCHYAHGTTAQGNNISTFSPAPGSTVLKRLDNMGVCENCHKK